MPRKRKKEQVRGQFFVWRIGARSNGVWYADGRGNTQDVGRPSLGTRDRKTALEHLARLDLVRAVEFGLADAALLKQDSNKLLSLEDGQRRYLEYVSRPPVQGGACAASVKRYRAVLDKFVVFAREHKVQHWQQVDKGVLMQYGKWLEAQDYHYATQYLESTTIKQVLKCLVSEGLLPATSLVTLKLKKPRGTNTYCYTHDQVRAMVTFCRKRADLAWLADVVVALATTGLRIGELAGLRWCDVDLERGSLHLQDTSRHVRKSKQKEARTTKSHRDRTLPLHEELRLILVSLTHRPDGRVFHGPKGGKLKPDTVRNVLKRDVLAALAQQFPASNDAPGILAGRVHSFRHFFCSMSADNGVPEQMLMTWLGHRDSTMIKHYYHLRQDEARKHMAKIQFLGESPTGTGEPKDGAVAHGGDRDQLF